MSLNAKEALETAPVDLPDNGGACNAADECLKE
jgi:hypothetical protein